MSGNISVFSQLSKLLSAERMLYKKSPRIGDVNNTNEIHDGRPKQEKNAVKIEKIPLS